MIRSIKYIVSIFLSMIWLRSEGLDKEYYSESQPIDLSVYDGQGSVLIHWITPNNIDIDQIALFVKEFGEQKFMNLYAVFKGGSGPNVCFAGHTDVVPPGDEASWDSDTFTAVDLNSVVVVRTNQKIETDGFTSQDLQWQEQRRKRKVRKLNFEVR